MADKIEAMGFNDPFDPLAAMDFDGAESEYQEYVPPIVKPDEDEVPVEQPELPAEERIAAAFKGMPGCEQTLVHIIEFCKDGRSVEEIVDEVRATTQGHMSVYTPETMCSILERAGALNVVADEPAEEDEVSDDAGEEGYLVVAPASFRYFATAEGLAAVPGYDPALNMGKVLQEAERYAPVFMILLEECLDEGGCTKKEIDELVDNHPLCMEPRRFSGFFLKSLESAGALTFDGSWHTTESGKSLLESIR